MEEQIKVLENDIMELTKMIEEERKSRKMIKISGFNSVTEEHGEDGTINKLYANRDIYQKDTDKNKDYNDYKKLVDTIVTNFKTYLRFREVKYNNSTCVRYKEWLEKEIIEVHRIMEKAQKDNYDQYRCLNYVYTKLLNELNSYNLRKPIKLNDDITIEVEGRTLGEVMEDIALAWNKLNKDDRDETSRIILNGIARQVGDSMNNMGESLKSVLKRYKEKA